MFIFLQRPASQGSFVYSVSKHYMGLNNIAGTPYTRIQVSDIVLACLAKAMVKPIEHLQGMDGTCSYAVLRNAEYKTYEHKSSAANVEARNILKLMTKWAKEFPEGVWQCV